MTGDVDMKFWDQKFVGSLFVHKITFTNPSLAIASHYQGEARFRLLLDHVHIQKGENIQLKSRLNKNTYTKASFIVLKSVFRRACWIAWLEKTKNKSNGSWIRSLDSIDCAVKRRSNFKKQYAFAVTKRCLSEPFKLSLKKHFSTENILFFSASEKYLLVLRNITLFISIVVITDGDGPYFFTIFCDCTSPQGVGIKTNARHLSW